MFVGKVRPSLERSRCKAVKEDAHITATERLGMDY
jgi:hypothetical protein